MELSDRKWNEFYIGGNDGIFEIKSTSSGIDKNKLEHGDEKENIPYITRTDVDNGVNLFISEKQKNKYFIDKGNAITIGLDTQTVFYQQYRFYTGQNIQVLRHPKLNKTNSLFIIPLIKIQMEKFNWGGNGATLGRLFRTKLMLPINDDNEPDWDFMEKYIEAQRTDKDNAYEKYVRQIVNNLEFKEIVHLTAKKWKDFDIEQLFKVSIGKNIDGNKVNKTSGKTAYITRKESNNGLDGFIDNDIDKMNLKFPVITIGNETAQPYIQKYPFYTGTKVNILEPLNNVSDKVLHFIVVLLQQHKSKYNYSYTVNSTRLKKQKIMVPVNDNNEPDYEYMEQYIKNIMIAKYSSYTKKSTM